MESYLETEANAHVKGFNLLVVTNFKTRKERIVGVRYRRKPSDPGIMLNFCPWCGNDIKAAEGKK